MQEAVAHIRSVTGREPRIVVVLGSGLGAFADVLADPLSIRYSEIPGWPASTAVGHSGKLVFGKLGKLDIAVMAGRAHLYEGYSPAQVTFGVRVLHRLGARSVVFTNAAGGINLSYRQGALVLISDHINLQGSHPLIGPNDDSVGPRFPDMSEAYSSKYRATAREVAHELKIQLEEGVYAALTGPSYETPAEIRYLRTIGADLVGMSTVPEVIVANYLGMRVLAISCVTNMAAGILPQERKGHGALPQTGQELPGAALRFAQVPPKINHEEVLEAGRKVRDTLIQFLKALLPKL